MDAESDEKQPGSRAPRFVKASRPLHRGWQVLIFLLGLAIVVGGIIMLALPGPGWLVIFAGIGVWATEFSWARRVLHWTKQQLREWAHRWTAWWQARRERRAQPRQSERQEQRERS